MKHHLSIPTPCHESWDAMTPAPGGRHCARCSKVVQDYTHCTSASEVIAAIRATAGQVCGRIPAHLLGVQPAPAPRLNAWRRMFLTALFLAFQGMVFAQTTVLPELPSVTIPSNSDTLEFIFKVTDKDTHQKIPFASVVLNNTIVLVADSNGVARLKTPLDHVSSPYVQVEVNSVYEYAPYQHTLFLPDYPSNIIEFPIQLFLDRITTLGMPIFNPWHYYNRSQNELYEERNH